MVRPHARLAPAFMLGVTALGWMLALACADEAGREWEKALRPLARGRKETVALLFPSEGCPCRYAPLLDALHSTGKGEGPPLVLALAAPAPAHGEGVSEVPYLWNADVQRLRNHYGPGKSAGPFLVLVRAGQLPEVLLAARVPQVPVRQRELATLALALAEEREAKP